MTKKQFLIVLAIAAVLRVANVWHAPLWYDESFSYLVARLPLNRLMAATMGDVHPPLYYLVILPFAKVGIPWLVRVPSILFSLAALWAWWRILKHYALPTEQEIAGVALMAVMPYQLWYAQEARMYSLLIMLVLLAWLAVLAGRWVWLAVLTAAIMYTHNYGMFYLPALWLAGLWRDRRALVPLTAALGLGLLAWAPWLVVLLGQMADVSRGYWIDAPSIGSVFHVLASLLGPFTIPDWASLPITIMLLTVLFFVPLCIERPRLDVLIMALGPLTLAIIASLVWKPILLFRGLSGSAPFLMWLAFIPLASIRPVWGRAVVAGLIGPFLVVALYGLYVNTWDAKGGGFAGMFVRTIPAGATVVYSADDGWINAEANLAGYAKNVRIQPCGHDNGALSPATRAALGIPFVERVQDGYFYMSLNPMSDQCSFGQSRAIVGGRQSIVNMSRPGLDGIVMQGIYKIP